MYLGRSPMHVRSIALVLNLETGQVSPQFHVVFDPTFRSINPEDGSRKVKISWLENVDSETKGR